MLFSNWNKPGAFERVWFGAQPGHIQHARLWEVGFTPRPIAHGPRDGYLSSSGAMKSLHAGLPSNAKLVRYPSRGPCLGIMPKAYPFWASDNPLWYFNGSWETWSTHPPEKFSVTGRSDLGVNWDTWSETMWSEWPLTFS